MLSRPQVDGKGARDGTAGALVLDGDGATMATVTVESIEQAGKWTAFGKTINQKCYTLSVSYK